MESLELLQKDDTLKLRKRHLGESCKLFFRSDPIKIVRGEGQYMYDEKDRRYLDCINNVAHVGHCEKRVVEAVYDQMKLLNTNNRFLHDKIVLCAQKIAQTFPEELSVCFFVNSGSEGNDLALRLAKAHTGNTDIICLQGAYHGHLTSLMEISPYKFNKDKFPKPDHVHVAPLPDSYRGKYRTDEEGNEDVVGEKYADEVKQILNQARESGRGVAAFIAESAPSCAGQMLLPNNYLRNVYKHVREAGGVCIADEVQIGFGRTGKHWWGFQLQGDDVIPDIVTIGKSMGNGFPVAAVVTTREVAKSLADTGMEYFNTYGGNAASCSAALAVIDVVEKEGLREHASEVGQHLLRHLKKLQEKYSVIGDVRGAGLFIGVELVTDRKNRTPATALAQHIVTRMREEMVLMSNDGPDRNVLKFKPPMVFNMENADELLTKLERVLDEIKEALPNGIPEKHLQDPILCATNYTNRTAKV